MCLFFGQLVPHCDHAQCQIVSTIRSLNERTLFEQAITHHERQTYRQEPIVSIANMVQEHPFKVEERDPESLGEQIHEDRTIREEIYKQKVDRLEQQVRELRQLTMWMKNELQKKGLLS